MKSNKKERHILENVVFSLGSLLLMLIVGYLIFQIVTVEPSPPKLYVKHSYEKDSQFLTYKITVENTGEETAENCNIVLGLYENGEIAEEGTIVVDFVPPHSTQKAWIVFYGRKQKGDSVVVSSLTYKKP